MTRAVSRDAVYIYISLIWNNYENKILIQKKYDKDQQNNYAISYPTTNKLSYNRKRIMK